MNHSSPSARNRAFTRIELAVVIVVIVVLAVLFVPALARRKARASRASCVNHLKSIGLAFRISANDNGSRLPWELSTNQGGSREFVDAPFSVFRHLLVMSNELYGPKILLCPEDGRRTSATNWASLTDSNLSYFIGLDATDARPMALLSGDRNLSTNGVPVGPGLLYLTRDSVLGWTKEMHRGMGNVVLGDGSVQQMNGASPRHAQIAGATDRLLIP